MHQAAAWVRMCIRGLTARRLGADGAKVRQVPAAGLLPRWQSTEVAWGWGWHTPHSSVPQRGPGDSVSPGRLSVSFIVFLKFVSCQTLCCLYLHQIGPWCHLLGLFKCK